MILASLSDEGEQNREVYARAGLSLYAAQVWERGMVNLALVTRANAGKYANTEDWDSDESKLTSLTAGTLRNQLLKDGFADAPLIEAWSTALTERNHLVHGFFWEHAVDFFTVQGRQRMVDALDAMRVKFEDADEDTDRVVQAIVRRWGVGANDVQQVIDTLLAEAEPADKPH